MSNPNNYITEEFLQGWERVANAHIQGRSEAGSLARALSTLIDAHRTLQTAVAAAVAELDAVHDPMWASHRSEELGEKPIGCALCFPGDGSWPCTTRMVADDLRVTKP